MNGMSVTHEKMAETEVEIGHCAFAYSGQVSFARLSGDYNPIHLNPKTAEDSPFGQIVLHGIHGALKLLDAYAAWMRRSNRDVKRYAKIKVELNKPIFLNETVKFFLVERTANRHELRARVFSADVAKITLDQPVIQPDSAHAPILASKTTKDLTGGEGNPDQRSILEEFNRSGEISLDLSPDLLIGLFPNCVDWWGLRVTAAACVISTVVGMKWPGLDSLLTEVLLRFEEKRSDGNALSYRVRLADPRYGLTKLDIAAPDFVGEVSAYFRPPPVVQPKTRELQQFVDPSEFAGQVIYVIGGSQGLGELSAKLLALGGGQPIITYHKSTFEAERVATEIRDAGLSCSVRRLDVLDITSIGACLRQGPAPTMLLYYATPRIFQRRVEKLSRELLELFMRYYCSAFFDCVNAALRFAPSTLSVLYPSSVALDKPVEDLAEYSMAKAAGEMLCRILANKHTKLSIAIERFPRLATAQTNSIVRTMTADPVNILLPVLRQLAQTPRLAPPHRNVERE